MRELGASLLVAALMCTRVFGQMYEVWTTSSLTLQLKAPKAKGEVLFWSKAGRWERPPFQWQNGTVRCTLALDNIAKGRTTLLVGRPAGVDINDRQAPKISVSLDGRAVAPGLEPLAFSKPPARLECVVEDAANRVDANALRVLLDGTEIPTTASPATSTGRRMTLRASLPPLDFGDHALVTEAQDVSPFRNRAALSVQFSYTIGRDLAQASLGAKVQVDSCYPNYAAAPLIDGDWQSCAASGSPQVTWASAETETNHWIAIDLPKPQAVESVSLFWVRKKPSRAVQVQIRRGADWVTVGSAQPHGPCTATTIRVAPSPVKTLRILQPKGSGLPDRPHLLWVGEIVVTPR